MKGTAIPETFESDETLVQALHHSKSPMWIFDQGTLRFLEVNQAAIQTYGYSRQEFLALTVLDIRPSGDVPLFLENEVLRHHSSIVPERWVHLRKDNVAMAVEIESQEMAFRGRPVELVQVTPRETPALPDS